MKQYFKSVLSLTRTLLVRILRDKRALLLTILLPLIFLFIFGWIYGMSSSSATFTVDIINNSTNSFSKGFVDNLKKSKNFKINSQTASMKQVQNQLDQSEIDAAIVLPSNFGDLNNRQQPSGTLQVYHANNNEQSGQVIASVMQNILNNINFKYGFEEPALNVESKSNNSKSISSFDYLFAGLLGYTLLSVGIFGLANTLPALKKTGALRRFEASPFTAGQLILAEMLFYTIIGMISLSLMFIVGIYQFNFHMIGNWLELIFFLTLSLITIIGIGLAIGGWAKNDKQSAPLASLVAIPLMFLCGTFFPSYLMPNWLQTVSKLLPLTPINDGLRFIMTENKSLIAIAPQLGLVAIWLVVIYVIAIKLFKWE